MPNCAMKFGTTRKNRAFLRTPSSSISLKRAAPKPFSATSTRKSAFDPKAPTPGPTDYNPEAADPLRMSVANAKSISLPGTHQSVDMGHLYYDRASLGPGKYEQPEETAQRAPAGQGHKSNFVGGTGRQAIDPAELAVKNGIAPSLLAVKINRPADRLHRNSFTLRQAGLVAQIGSPPVAGTSPSARPR